MSREFNGTTDRIDYANVLNPVGQAQTFAAWFWIDTLDAATQYLWSSHAAGDGTVGTIFYIGGTNDDISLFSNGSTTIVHQSSTTVTTGAWVHLACTWDGGTAYANIHIYKDGSEVSYTAGQNGSSLTAATGSWSFSGRIYDDARNFDGKMASAGFWSRILSQGELTALATGFHPWMFPTGLVFSPDLDGLMGTANDPWGGKTATLDGTAVSAHPTKLIYPNSRMVVPSAGAPPAAGGHPAVKRFGGIPFAARMAGAGSPRGVQIW